MRIAETIDDVVELLADYEVSILAGDGIVAFEFPPTEEERKHKPNLVGYEYEHLKDDDPTKFTKMTRYAIRSMVGSPRWWRTTTVADQLARFCLVNNKKDSPYGKVNAKKRANEPLHLVFENNDFAEKFLEDLESRSK